MKTPEIESIGRSPLRRGLLLIALMLGCFGLSPQAQTVDPVDHWRWTTTGSLNTARTAHTATLLQNGMVLVAGGYDNNGFAVASAELYDPASGTWTTTDSLNNARAQHTATLLQNGMVLVAGGSDIYDASVELYSPASGTWRWTTIGFLHVARFFHTATSLQNGIVLVAGGYDTHGRVVARAELGRPPF